MSDWTLDDVAALHRELIALDAAGVKVGLGLDQPDKSVDEVLQQATSQLAMQIARGATLAEAVDDPHTPLPEAYRRELQVGLRTGSLTTVLEGGRRSEAAKAELRQIVRRSIAYPALLVLLVCLGLALQSETLFPAIQGIYEQMRVAPGPAIEGLAQFASYWPAWIAAAGAILLAVVLLLRRARPNLRRIPGVSRYLATIEQEHLASQLAALCESGTPLDQAVPLACGLAGNAQLASALASHDLAGSSSRQGRRDRSRRLRPLLKWALTSDLPPLELGPTLSLVGETYRQSAQRQALWLRFSIPAISCATIGGSVVFLYGLMLFGPWVELLSRLAAWR